MVTKEEVQAIAKLAKLYVPEEKLDEVTAGMADMIAFANTISSVVEDADDFDNINNLSNVFREDEVVPSYDRTAILSNVGGGEDGFFPVKKRM